MVALISATLLFTPTKVYGEERVTNRFDDWKTTAIISPKSGELKAAGPIEIEFKQLDLENVKIDHYDLYLDGDKPQDTIESSGEETLIGEVYTTEVAVHNLQVVAVTDDNHEISSNVRKILVSKKGLNIDDKAVKNTVENMNESWYYNWGINESNYVSDNKEFVPMIWNQDSLSWLQSEDAQKYSTILGFNEPDLESQANIAVETAAGYQEKFTESGLRVGSPAMASYPLNDWYQQYSKIVEMDDIDFIPVHIYYDWAGEGMAEAFLKVIDETYAKYGKPIWVTEYGIANEWLYGAHCSDKNVKDIKQYMKDTIAGLEERDYVERYTWFNFGLDSNVGGKTALYNQDDGKLTQLGELYASLGNPDTEGIDLNDEYIEDDAYYRNLDDLIAKVDKIINDSQYQINDTLIDAFNKAKAVDRYLGSNNQYIIDQLTETLNNEYNKVEKKIFVNEENQKTKEIEESSSITTGDNAYIIGYLLLVMLSFLGVMICRKRFN